MRATVAAKEWWTQSSCFVPLEFHQDAAGGLGGGESGGAALGLGGETELAGVFPQFINTQVVLAFAVPFRDGEVDRSGFLAGVDAAGPLGNFLAIDLQGPDAVGAIDHLHFGDVAGRGLVAPNHQTGHLPGSLDLFLILGNGLVTGFVGDEATGQYAA